MNADLDSGERAEWSHASEFEFAAAADFAVQWLGAAHKALHSGATTIARMVNVANVADTIPLSAVLMVKLNATPTLVVRQLLEMTVRSKP